MAAAPAAALDPFAPIACTLRPISRHITPHRSVRAAGCARPGTAACCVICAVCGVLCAVCAVFAVCCVCCVLYAVLCCDAPCAQQGVAAHVPDPTRFGPTVCPNDVTRRRPLRHPKPAECDAPGLLPRPRSVGLESSARMGGLGECSPTCRGRCGGVNADRTPLKSAFSSQTTSQRIGRWCCPSPDGADLWDLNSCSILFSSIPGDLRPEHAPGRVPPGASA